MPSLRLRDASLLSRAAGGLAAVAGGERRGCLDRLIALLDRSPKPALYA